MSQQQHLNQGQFPSPNQPWQMQQAPQQHWQLPMPQSQIQQHAQQQPQAQFESVGADSRQGMPLWRPETGYGIPGLQNIQGQGFPSFQTIGPAPQFSQNPMAPTQGFVQGSQGQLIQIQTPVPISQFPGQLTPLQIPGPFSQFHGQLIPPQTPSGHSQFMLQTHMNSAFSPVTSVYSPGQVVRPSFGNFTSHNILSNRSPPMFSQSLGVSPMTPRVSGQNFGMSQFSPSVNSNLSIGSQMSPQQLAGVYPPGQTILGSHLINEHQYQNPNPPQSFMSSQPVLPINRNPYPQLQGTALTPGLSGARIRDSSMSSVRSQKSGTPTGPPRGLIGHSTPTDPGSLEIPVERQARAQNAFAQKNPMQYRKKVYVNSALMQSSRSPSIPRNTSAQRNSQVNIASNIASNAAVTNSTVTPMQNPQLGSKGSASRIVSVCNTCSEPNHWEDACKAGGKKIKCISCGFLNHLQKDCRWYKVIKSAKSTVQTPQMADFGQSHGTKRTFSQSTSGRPPLRTSGQPPPVGVGPGNIDPKRAVPTSRDFVKIGEPQNLESPAVYTICLANWDSAIGILTDPKPTKEMRNMAHPPLLMRFGDGLANPPMLALNLHCSQKVTVRSVVRIGDRISSEPFVELFIDSGLAMFTNVKCFVPKASHLAVEYTPDQYVSACVIQDQLGFISQGGTRVSNPKGTMWRIYVASLNLGKETRASDYHISHEFKEFFLLAEKEPVLLDLFQVIKGQHEKLGPLIIPIGIFDEKRLKSFPPGCLIKSVKPMFQTDRKAMIQIGQFEQNYSNDLERCKADFKKVKECHGAAIIVSQFFKRRALEQCIIAVDLAKDAFGEDHVTTVVNVTEGDVTQNPFTEKSRGTELRPLCSVVVEAANWDKPEKKGNVKIVEVDDLGKPKEEELPLGLSPEEFERKTREHKRIMFESKRFAFSGRLVGGTTTDIGQPDNLDIARDIRVAIMSEQESSDRAESEIKEIRLKMQIRAFEMLQTPREEREHVKTSPEFVDLLNKLVSDRTRTMRMRRQNEPDRVQGDEAKFDEIKYPPEDDPGETDEMFMRINNLLKPGVKLYVKGNILRTGLEYIANESIEWDICWHDRSFCRIMVLTLLGHEVARADFDLAVEWRRKYKILKRLIRGIDMTYINPDSSPVSIKKLFRNYSFSLDPFERASLQDEIDEIDPEDKAELERLAGDEKALESPLPPSPEGNHKFFEAEDEIIEGIRPELAPDSDFFCPIDDEIDRSDSSYGAKTDDEEVDQTTGEIRKLVKVFNGRKCVLRAKVTQAMVIKKIEEHKLMNDGQKEVLLQFFRDNMTGAICQAPAGTGKTWTLGEFVLFLRYYYVKFLALCITNNNEAAANIAASLYKSWAKLARKERKQHEILLLRSNQVEHMEKIAERVCDVDYARMTLESHLLFMRKFTPSDRPDGLTEAVMKRIDNYLQIRADNPRVFTNDTEMINLVIRFQPNLRVVVGTMEKTRLVAKLDVAQFIFADEAGQSACSDLIQFVSSTKGRFLCFFGDRLQIGPWCPFPMYRKYFHGRQRSILDVGHRRARQFSGRTVREVPLKVNYRARPDINAFTSASMYNSEVTSGITDANRTFMQRIKFPAPKRGCAVTICNSNGRCRKVNASKSVYNLRHEDLSIRLFEFIARLARRYGLLELFSYAFNCNYEAPASNIKKRIELCKGRKDELAELYQNVASIVAATNTSFQGKETDVAFWHTSKTWFEHEKWGGEPGKVAKDESSVEFALNSKLTTTGATRAREMLFPFCCVEYLVATNKLREFETNWDKIVVAARRQKIPIVDIEALVKFYESKGPNYDNWEAHYFSYGEPDNRYDLLVDEMGVSFIVDLPCTKFWEMDGVKLRPSTPVEQFARRTTLRTFVPTAPINQIIDSNVLQAIVNRTANITVSESDHDRTMQSSSSFPTSPMEISAPVAIAPEIAAPTTSRAVTTVPRLLTVFNVTVGPQPPPVVIGSNLSQEEKSIWRQFAAALKTCNEAKRKPLYKPASAPDGSQVGLFFSPDYTASNFYISPIVGDGMFFRCSEFYYIYAKCVFFNRLDVWEQAKTKNTCGQAKGFAGATLNLTKAQQDNWHGLAVDVMRKIVYLKFYQNNVLRQQLINSYNVQLVEASPKDKFWGVGMNINTPEAADQAEWLGENQLGKILEEVRELLSYEPTQFEMPRAY